MESNAECKRNIPQTTEPEVMWHEETGDSLNSRADEITSTCAFPVSNDKKLDRMKLSQSDAKKRISPDNCRLRQ